MEKEDWKIKFLGIEIHIVVVFILCLMFFAVYSFLKDENDSASKIILNCSRAAKYAAEDKNKFEINKEREEFHIYIEKLCENVDESDFYDSSVCEKRNYLTWYPSSDFEKYYKECVKESQIQSDATYEG